MVGKYKQTVKKFIENLGKLPCGTDNSKIRLSCQSVFCIKRGIIKKSVFAKSKNL